MPCQALSPPPGSTVLDACAAPGNKTICLANYLKNKGFVFELIQYIFIVGFCFSSSTLYAIEMNKRRFKELNINLKTAGVKCAQTFNGNFLEITLPFDEIDYILLDPSCSGSGIRNRNDDPDIIDEERLERLASLQIRMVTYALANFPNVKRVTYSTCSIHSQENEEVVEKILDQFHETFQVYKINFFSLIYYYFVSFSLLIFYRTGQVVDKLKGLMHVYVHHLMIP